MQLIMGFRWSLVQFQSRLTTEKTNKTSGWHGWHGGFSFLWPRPPGLTNVRPGARLPTPKAKLAKNRYCVPGIPGSPRNFDAFKYGYYANDFLERREIPTQGRYQRWLISFQTYSVVARNPRGNIGMIYGLPGD